MGIRLFLCVLAGLGLAVSAYCAQEQALFSSETSDLFARFGSELIAEQPEKMDAAMTFLGAGILLDEKSLSGYEQFLRAAGKTCGWQHNYSDTVLLSLQKYLDRKADLEVAIRALSCVLDNNNTRIQRELILEKLMSQIAQANPVFSSDVAAQLGFYAVEKADYTTAIKQFEYAWSLNQYNLQAYSKLHELRTYQERGAAVHDRLIYLRLRLAVNPADLEAVVEFGRTACAAELYTLAADAFEYAASLHAWLSPNSPPNEEILISWAESCYYIPSRQIQCITLADQLRAAGKFSLEMDSIAGLAAQKLGKTQQGQQILSAAADRAQEYIAAGLADITPAELGWFYCFALEDPEKAAAWCNRAFTQDAQDPIVKSLMAYALYLNDQDQLAGEYCLALDPNIPAAGLTLASIDIRNDQKQKAVKRLMSLLEGNVPLAVRTKVVRLLKDCGIDYSSNLPVESIQENIAKLFGGKIIPPFVSPDKMFSARLTFNGSEFSYGSTIECQLVIANTSSMPLVIERLGLLTGQYQVDAVVGGDLKVTIPGLLEGTFRPARPILPGESVSVRLNVDTGKLKKLFFTCPQASLEVAIRVYLNPVHAEDGSVACGIPGQKVIETNIRRKGITLSSEYLLGRLDALTKGQEGLKIRSAELFAGLYAEQLAWKAGTIRYRHTQADAALLTDAVRLAIKDENWKIGVHMLMLLSEHSMPLDYAMTLSVSESLNHPNWPVRMAAMWLLTNQPNQKISSFQSVLDWNAQYDPFWLNRQMAVILGGTEVKPRVPESGSKTPKSDVNDLAGATNSLPEKKI